MILSKKINIRIIPRILKYYQNIGYVVKVGEIITIDIVDLSKGSNIKIDVKCDVCGKEKKLSYQKYNKSLKTYDFYSCSQKCSVDKCKMTFNKNYNCDHPMKNEIIKDKVRKTNLEKYGVEYYTITNDFKEKSKETNLKRYGETHPMKNEIIKEKLKNVLIEKYGIENPMHHQPFIDNCKKSKIKNNVLLPDEMIDDFLLYKRKVKNITHKNKKSLFENWNGYDYYDDEYIKENFSHSPTNRLYPTIDHKISVYFGFVNNIVPEIIGSLSNLCITKKYINSTKGTKNV